MIETQEQEKKKKNSPVSTKTITIHNKKARGQFDQFDRHAIIGSRQFLDLRREEREEEGNVGNIRQLLPCKCVDDTGFSFVLRKGC